ncbi:MAG: Rieske (2Fe-2S) protein [Acholeplasmataceae bacterium]|nr:Rieske (2Fe-2S) protein [Acholeplasmataceae bacterium]
MLHYALDYNDLVLEFKKKVIIEETPIMLALLADKVYAIQDKCTHLGGSLSKGAIENTEVKCRLHGAKFDLKTGNVIEKAHVGFVKMPTKKAKIFRTEVLDGKIFVEL